MRNRECRMDLERRFARKKPRILVLTGARQTGKTTLAKAAFPALPFVSLDDPVARPAYTALTAAEWVRRLPVAVLDEVQKAPCLVESVKAAHDMDGGTRYLLLGSSQILLLSRVRESLAGRVGIVELWPLTLPEMATSSWDDPLRPSRFIRWLRSIDEGEAGAFDVFDGIPAGDRDFPAGRELFGRYLRFGGLPAVHDAELTAAEKDDWLDGYRRTYLERDVADLAALRDLEPFVLAQESIARKTARTVNFSELARLSSISTGTARRFMRYLELSYQVFLLPPYFRSEEKRLAKMSKVHFVDPGVLRSVVNRRGDLTGEEFESAVVAEILKQVRNSGLRIRFHHLRTYDGREVDLLLETERHFVGVEVKSANKVSAVDARHLRGLDRLVGKPLAGSLVLSNDIRVAELAPGIVSLPAPWALA